MKITKAQIEWFTKLADTWLQERALDRSKIIAGRDAWAVCHRIGMYRELIDSDDSIVDAHIQTAMESMFPNVVFRDPKRY